MTYLIFSGIIISIFVLLLAFLFFPATICIDSSRSEGEIKGLFSIRWLVFKIKYSTMYRKTEISIFGKTIFQVKEKPGKKSMKRKKLVKVKKPVKLHNARAFLRVGRPLLRLFEGLILSFKLKYFDLHMTFGMKNPASTGFLAGLGHALRASMVALSPAYENIRWTADFRREVLEWELKYEVACRPIMVLYLIVRFFTSRQVLQFAIRSI